MAEAAPSAASPVHRAAALARGMRVQLRLRGDMTGAGSAGAFWGRQLAVALLFYVTGRVGMMMAVDHSLVTLVWPPSGIALVAILAFGYRMAYGIALGAFALNLTVGLSPAVAIAIAICDNLEYLGGAFLLKRLVGFHLELDRRQDVLALIVLAATVATTFSAFPGVAILTLSGAVSSQEFWWFFLKWWLAGMTGVLVVAPLLLVLLTHPRPRLSFGWVTEVAGLLAMLLAVLLLIFDTPILGGHGYYPAALAVFPFAIWGALRFGLWGVTLLNVIISALAIWGTRHGIGPFAAGSPIDSLVRWCVFTSVLSMIGLLLAAMAAEQRWARHALEQSHDELERRVKERTTELAQINEGLTQAMAVRRRLESELLQAEERQQRALGMELHDGLGQQLTSIAFFGATLRQRLEAQERPEFAEAKRIVDLVNQATKTVRALAHGLYAPALDSDGLPTALRELADSTRALKGASCEFHAPPLAEFIDPLLAINFYRSAQESVNNAIKHGRASHIDIELTRIDGQYRLTVRDDGIGFDARNNSQPEGVGRTSGMGLRNLRYRASLLGGTVSIESKPQQGTTVTICCPTTHR